MDVDEVKALCEAYAGSTWKLLGPPSNVFVYYAGGRKFAYFKTSAPEQWRFSFRTSPERFLELTDVPGFKPARYLARLHWVTVVDVRTVSSGELRELVGSSYAMAVSRARDTRYRVRAPAHAGHPPTPPRRRSVA